LDYGLNTDDLNKYSVEKVKNMIKLGEHKNNLPPRYEVGKIS